ncbi:hypothetical protein Pmani_006815 [Petrolisthes manimaculis]|uniref:Uncharacterized protein n=1 Tax=Petrolisthes manimaculis TaxID=1843537 RepID=A0AAE1UKS2_9EUCA|nr:hypothetical protein Pmani_006815 [Petrolisthes manimaculis]
MVQNGDDFTLRVSRHLAYISEFTTNIQHIQSEDNTEADDLSRGNEYPERGCNPSPTQTQPPSSSKNINVFDYHLPADPLPSISLNYIDIARV